MAGTSVSSIPYLLIMTLPNIAEEVMINEIPKVHLSDDGHSIQKAK